MMATRITTTDGYSSAEACRLAGVTYRQVDYWHRTAVLFPAIVSARGSGTRRRYAWRDVLVMAALGHLSRAGIRPGAAGPAVDALLELPAFVGVRFVVPRHGFYVLAPAPDGPLGLVLNLDVIAGEVTARLVNP